MTIDTAARERRRAVPRGVHGTWAPGPDRPDPVALLEAQGAGRIPALLGLRYARMAASPFAFLRGAAAVMAADLATRPRTDLVVQCCGDAHLSNFGLYATAERITVFDVNDFDETLPAPFEWDVKRLATSVEVAGRGNRIGRAGRRTAVLATVAAYRTALRRHAERRHLEVWYDRLDVDRGVAQLEGEQRRRVERLVRRAEARTQASAVAKLTEVVDGRRRFRDEPPLLVPVTDDADGHTVKLLERYRGTLSDHHRVLLDRYRPIAGAHKVVGVGSVGSRCWLVLFEGRDADDLIVLQLKEAVRSVLEPHTAPSAYENQGQRVVAGQHLVQASSDIFLGWCEGLVEGRAYYWRQLRDVKGSVDVARLDRRRLAAYGQLCGTALARGHARSGDDAAIAAYLGRGDRFDRALADFAAAYADQTEQDHAALVAAISSGRLPSAQPARP